MNHEKYAQTFVEELKETDHSKVFDLPKSIIFKWVLDE